MKFKAICPPEWLSKNAVYQINPRTFSKEGTIDAITAELPFIKSLGFNIVYLCPIFEMDASANLENFSKRQLASETGNPKNMYRMNDYFSIDEEYGTMDDLRKMVEMAHSLDMKVLFDLGVAVLVFKDYFIRACGFQLADLAVDILLVICSAATCISVYHLLLSL